mgnify:CR=1 FL=1
MAYNISSKKVRIIVTYGYYKYGYYKFLLLPLFIQEVIEAEMTLFDITNITNIYLGSRIDVYIKEKFGERLLFIEE